MAKNRRGKIQEIASEKLNEFIKCKNDFSYFFENYVILELAGGDVTVPLYNKQKELCDLIDKDKFVVVLKSRQTGISTVIQGYCAHALVFFDNVHVGIISKDGDEATSFARFISGIIEKLPPWMKPKFKKKTEQTFILTNGSKVYSSTVNPVQPDKTLRGKTLHILVIDEAAFCRNVDDAWTSLVPALSTAQKAARKAKNPFATIVISTPAKVVGIGAWYYQTYSRAIASDDDIFKPFIIHWKDIPELANDPEWYKNQCRLWGNDQKKIAQELNLQFGASEGSFLMETTVRQLQDSKIKPKKNYKIFNGEIWIFEDPIPNKNYLIGVDVAPEHGDDKSTIEVIDYETLEQVWEFCGKCKVKDLVNLVIAAITQYPGTIVVESNSYGNQVLEELNLSDFSQFVYKERRGENKLQAGVSTNLKTRPLMIDSLYACVTDFPDMIKSERLKLELIGLEYNKQGRVEASKGCHDDLAMALAFCFYIRQYDPPLMMNKKLMEDSFLKRALEMNDEHIRVSNNVDSINQMIRNNPEDYSGFVDILDLFRG
jgi:hypothetical protein